MSASFATGRVLTDKSDRPDSLSSLTTVDLIYYSPRDGAKWSSTVNVRKICDVVRRFIYFVMMSSARTLCRSTAAASRYEQF
jgi:hypothetical protein